MRKLLALAFMLSGFLFITSCTEDGGDDDGPITGPVGDIEVVVESNISGDATWSSDSVYVLAGRITVLDGATLTIEPGTIVKGQAGQGSNSTALLIARGGMLMAEGTAELPIIFTSIADEITPEDVAAGNFASPNLDPDVAGLWGGVLVLGSAPISAANDADEDISETQIDGIPLSDTNGLYGGSAADDNSGTISYISIRHGGTNIGAGNEINGLTLGGVGSATQISNVEIVANADDGIEWFGGNVDVTNALVWNSFDDGLDTDQDWIGTCDNFIIVAPNTGSAFELDGPEGSVNRGFHTFINGTVYAGENIAQLVDWDESTNAALIDIYFYGFDPEYGTAEDFSPVTDFGGSVPAESMNWQYTLPDGVPATQIFTDGSDAIATAVNANANTVGANASVFAGWTWAETSGALTEIGL